MTPDGDDVPGTGNAAYHAQLPKWRLVDDVLEGTEAIRVGGELYTPRARGEEDDRYKERLKQSRFYNMYRRALAGMVGRVFRRPPQIAEDGAAEFDDYKEDIDGQGTHLSVFARRLFRSAVHHGHAGILIEGPKMPDIGRRPTAADVTRYGLRPYWVMIRAPQIFDFDTQTVNGRERLRLLVIRETTRVRVARFREVPVERFRVLEMRGSVPTWEIWEKRDKDKVLVDGGQYLGATELPFVPCYADEPEGTLLSRPTLYDMAEVNLDHYATQTRHTYHESVASAPIPVIREEGPIEEEIPISVTNGIRLHTSIGDARWMETSGASLQQTRQTMYDLEQRAALLGLLMMVRRTNQAETAEAKRIDAVEGESILAVAARGLQDCLEQAAVMTAQMRGATAPSVRINLNFDGLTLTPDQFRLYMEMWEKGALSIDALWDVGEEGGLLPEGFDREAERRRLMESALAIAPSDPSPADDEDTP